MEGWRELSIRIDVNEKQYERLEALHELKKKDHPSLTLEDELSPIVQYLINQYLDRELDLEEAARNVDR